MGCVQFHAKRRARHLALAVLFVTLGVALLPGRAHAAVTTTAAPPSGTINQAGPQNQNFTGQVFGSGITTGSDCALSDDLQPGTCNQFDLEVGTAGSVDVVINWLTGLDDLDLWVYLCDSGTAPPVGVATFDPVSMQTTPVCTLVASSQMSQGTLDSTPAEGLTFNAQQTLTNSSFYRIIVTPFMSAAENYTGCAGYSGTCGPVPGSQPPPPPPPTEQQFLSGCTGDTSAGADRKMTGGADMAAPSGDKAHAAVNVRRKNGQLKGKINYTVDDPTKFKSDQIGCAAFADGSKTNQSNTTVFEGSVDVRGTGKLQQQGQPTQEVCFESHATDNGEPGAGRDQFDITFYPLVNGVCNTANPLPASQPPGPPITGGNLDYHFYCKDDD